MIIIDEKNTFKIGQLGKPHGIDGEISFHFTSDVFDTAEAQYLLLKTDGILVPFFIMDYRFRSDDEALIRFTMTQTGTEVAALQGAEVYMERKQLPEGIEPNGETNAGFSIGSYIGYDILQQDGTKTGTITDYNDSTENVLFIVQTPQDTEIVIPATERHIVMDLPEGLLEL